VSATALAQIQSDYIATTAEMFIAEFSRVAQPVANVIITITRASKLLLGVAINAVTSYRLLAKENYHWRSEGEDSESTYS
jgi:hypothetical protein